MASSPALAAGWTPTEAEDWLLSLELFGMRFGLDRMRALMVALGAPNRAFRAIHVVGTNGKSSTTRMIAALLSHHGVRTGAYLSPHLVSYAERIRVDGTDVSPEQFAASAGDARAAAARVDREREAGDGVTQFEALTAAAYARLAESRVEVAVVEAGLGGRWDATNVIDAEIAVLTNIGLEHTRWLGTTIAQIAREKLAVLAPGATLVLGSDLHPDAAYEAGVVAERQGATILRAPREPHAAGADSRARSTGGTPPGARVELLARGAFQRRNFAVACTAAEAYLGSLDDAAVRAPPRRRASPAASRSWRTLPAASSCSTAPTTPAASRRSSSRCPPISPGARSSPSSRSSTTRTRTRCWRACWPSARASCSPPAPTRARSRRRGWPSSPASSRRASHAPSSPTPAKR